jgi:hypothetical protein
MAVKRTVLSLLVVLLLAAGVLGGCDPDDPTTPPADALSAAWCQDIISRFGSLSPGEIPANLTTGDSGKTGGEFDVNTYFTVLTHLSLEPGYVLDYVYDFDGSAGSPLLYYRAADAAPFKTYADYADAANSVTRPESDMSQAWLVAEKDGASYGSKIVLDGTDEAFFEYSVLQILGEQFYLFWHANYNDIRIVCENSELESVLTDIDNSDLASVSGAFKRDARKINLQPSVAASGDTVTVELVAFSKWGGFSRLSILMDRHAPYAVIGLEDVNLLEYQCGMMF